MALHRISTYFRAVCGTFGGTFGDMNGSQNGSQKKLLFFTSIAAVMMTFLPSVCLHLLQGGLHEVYEAGGELGYAADADVFLAVDAVDIFQMNG